jgi:hypothetical protein
VTTTWTRRFDGSSISLAGEAVESATAAAASALAAAASATAAATSALAAAASAANINVKVVPYGAAGDGTTDDATALQAALTACPDGGAVYFPRGTYKTTAGLTVSGKSIKLYGEGTVSLANTGAAVFLLTLTSCPAVTVEGLTFTSTRTTNLHGNTGATAQGIVADTCGSVTIQHNTISYRTDAIRCVSCTSARVFNNTCFNLGEEGVVITGCGNAAVAFNNIYNHNGDGILIKQNTGSGPVQVAFNDIHDGVNTFGYSAEIGGGVTNNDEVLGAASSYHDLSIIGNRIWNTKYGVGLTDASRFVIANNTIRTVNQQGIIVYGSTTNNPSLNTQELGSITGNVIEAALQGGIHVISGSGITCRWCQITGNVIDAVGDSGTNIDAPGLAADDCTITGNRVRNSYIILSAARCDVTGNTFDTSPRWVSTGNNPSIKLTGTGMFNSNRYTDGYGLIRIIDYEGTIQNNYIVTGNTNWLRVQGTFANKLDIRGNVVPTATGVDLQVGSGWAVRTVKNIITFYGSTTVTGGSVAAGATTTITATVSGALTGDVVSVSGSVDMVGVTATAWVSSTDTVTIRLQNPTASPVSWASIVFRVLCSRKEASG